MKERLLSEHLRTAEIISHEPVKLRAGEVSGFYADIKKAYGNPELLAEIADATLQNISPRTTCLAASGYGGLPLGVAVSQLSGMPLAMVRDAEKAYGRKQAIDGYVPHQHDAVTLLDDVFTSGSSLSEAAEILQKTGANIIGCHVVVARGDIEAFDLPVSYLFRPEDIV